MRYIGYGIILFDADGTLLDFHRSEREAVFEAFSEMGLSASGEMLDEYSRINDSLWKLLEKGGIEKNVLVYRRFEIFYEKYGISADARLTAEVYMDRLSEKGYLLDGAEALCRKLYGRAKMYIATNGVRSIQESRLTRSGLLKYFDGVFISECAGCEKPRREFFEYAARHIPDFDKIQAVIVGDSLSSDIRGGINYGIDTCWYTPTGAEAPKDIAPLITHTVRDFDGMYKILTKGD